MATSFTHTLSSTQKIAVYSLTLPEKKENYRYFLFFQPSRPEPQMVSCDKMVGQHLPDE